MRVFTGLSEFPKTFWSYEKILELVNRKVLLPPLGLVTVAAILPQEWEFKLVDRNIRAITEEEWQWAELVICSAMIVQKEDLLAQIREAKRRGKLVACGGPYPTSLPEEPQAAGVDYLILDEGEITLPMFVEAIARGETSGIYRSGGENPTLPPPPSRVSTYWNSTPTIQCLSSFRGVAPSSANSAILSYSTVANRARKSQNN